MPHFAIIADESASHGREILSNNRKEKIALSNSRGQAYDTTASMSSDKKGVHTETAKDAPDAEYQGCCLHSINLVICHACKITAIQNMMDSCHELFAFFDNSPKRQKLLKIVVEALSPERTKKKLKDLCKTRWVARHTSFETIFDLYEYIVITLNEICQPTNDVRFYPNDEEWSWDGKTKAMANGLRHTMTDFGFIVSFLCAKEMLEPMQPLVSSLGKDVMLKSIYFGFQKIEEINSNYVDIRKEIDAWFAPLYDKILSLARTVGSNEQRSRV
ncbi:52 kDa repressor of the inhibitor of the protein kinase [Exaiptasia diaphana]|nr:52 kDa repressor of the inhibitor of the protein kinase [Exaiptasia diaphana]